MSVKKAKGEALSLDLYLEHLGDGILEVGTEAGQGLRTLAGLHPLITEDRDTGNGFYILARHYPSNDVEITALRMTEKDTLRRGGGAKRQNSTKEAMASHVLEKSIKRARTTVRRKVLTMEADRLLTLTFRDNITDIDEAWICFKYFTKLMRWKYGERFQYVVVPEYQKRGAVHFHLAIHGYYHANTVRKLWHRATGERGGNIDITSPRIADKKSWNPRRIANYISKYISKIDSVEFNRKRYASGGKIKVPDSIKGWMALGLPVLSVLHDIARQITTQAIVTTWESEAYLGITYIST